VNRNNKLTVFYSDQKDAKYAQKISHRTTTEDFESWSTPADAVTSQVSTDRLGSPTVAKVPSSFISRRFFIAMANQPIAP